MAGTLCAALKRDIKCMYDLKQVQTKGGWMELATFMSLTMGFTSVRFNLCGSSHILEITGGCSVTFLCKLY